MSLYSKPRLVHKGYIDLYSLFYIKLCMAVADAVEGHLINVRARYYARNT